STLAVQQSDNLRAELTLNPKIRKFFGEIKGDVFTKEQWVARIGDKEICVMPRGSGQQVRGLLWRNHRPDLILIDDLEDPDEVRNEDLRAKTLEWFYGSLMNCVDRGSKNFRIRVAGTV